METLEAVRGHDGNCNCPKCGEVLTEVPIGFYQCHKCGEWFEVKAPEATNEEDKEKTRPTNEGVPTGNGQEEWSPNAMLIA